MTKNCPNCSKPFAITTIDSAFYTKMDVSPPTLCPRCRMQRRLSYRNDRSLYRSTCALSNQNIITMYNPSMSFSVYDYKTWWSDAWDPFAYARDFDFNKNFFEQFAALRGRVPRFNVFNRNSENCDYVNYAPHCKNCYLLFGAWGNEDCYYSQTLNECTDCMDCLFLDSSELCYQNVDCNDNYSSFFCRNSSNATDSWFCFDCRNVNNCIGCYNLRNKEYYIENKPASKERFEALKTEFSSHKTLSKWRQHFLELHKKYAVHRYMSGINNQNVSGDFIFNCKNTKNAFSVYRCEDIAYAGRLFEQKDSYDTEGGGKGELTYESMSNDFAYNSICCTTCENLTDSHYCDLCFNCESCFGCIGLRHASHCVLNRQYSKDDYTELLSRIKQHMRNSGEWGEFPPISLSPFAYNETMAQEYYPLTLEQAASKGYRWKEEEECPKLQTAELADRIQDVDDSILKQVLACASCAKNYKLIPRELEFYRIAGLPVPRRCHDCRHAERLALRNPRQLWTRACSDCGSEVETAYSPEREERVVCEECYERMV